MLCVPLSPLSPCPLCPPVPSVPLTDALLQSFNVRFSSIYTELGVKAAARLKRDQAAGGLVLFVLDVSSWGMRGCGVGEEWGAQIISGSEAVSCGGATHQIIAVVTTWSDFYAWMAPERDFTLFWSPSWCKPVIYSPQRTQPNCFCFFLYCRSCPGSSSLSRKSPLEGARR